MRRGHSSKPGDAGWRYSSGKHSPEVSHASESGLRALGHNETTAPKAVYLQCADRCAEFREETTELKLQLLRFQINAAAISELHPRYGFRLMFPSLPQTTTQFFLSQLLLKPPVDPGPPLKLKNCAALPLKTRKKHSYKVNCFLRTAK